MSFKWHASIQVVVAFVAVTKHREKPLKGGRRGSL